MLRIVITLALFLSLSTVSTAQETAALDVYPVRVNHRMGYIRFYPYDGGAIIIDTVIPPQYDYIGDINLPYNTMDADGAPSPYRIFEMDEKVGLLGPSLHPAVPNNYNRIRVVTDTLLAVEQDSLFALVDTSGRVYMDSMLYQDICLAEHLPEQGLSYFFVKNEKGWGLRRLAGPVLVDNQYGDIRQAGTPGFYKVKKKITDSQWMLIDSTGREVLKKPYEDILVLDSTFIALLQEANWQLIHRRRGPKGDVRGGFVRFEESYEFFETIEKVNSRLAILVPAIEDPVVELWDIRAQKRLVKKDARKRTLTGDEQPGERQNAYLPWYFPIEGEELFAVCNYDHNRVGEVDYLIDTTGNFISAPYGHIEPSGKPHVFRVGKRGRWALLAPLIDSLPLTRCNYYRIAPFRENIAVTRIGDNFGAIVITGNGLDSLPCVYDNLALQAGDKLKVRLGGRQIADYSLDSLDKLSLDTVYSGLYIAEDANRPFREAQPVQVQASSGYAPRTFDWAKVYVTEEPHRLLLNKAGEAGSAVRWQKKLPFTEKPIAIKEVVEDSILVFTHRGRPVGTAFTKVLCAREVAGKAFYDLGRGEDITDFTILGLRDFDYNYPYTAFIDEKGKMGLVSPFGEQLAKDGQALRYTYIGPFRAGRARACIGGRLSLYRKGVEHEQPAKFRLGYQWAFTKEFNINTIDAAPAAVQDGEVYILDGQDDPCRWVYIDTAGTVVLQAGAAHVEDFQEADSAAFALILERSREGLDLYGRPDADYGVIDEAGKVLIEPAYDDIRVFPAHFSVTKRRTPVFFFNSKGHELFINRTRLRPFSEGLAHFYDEEKRWGYIDSTGREAIPPRFLKARPFSEGLAAVVDTSGFCSFIDKRGNIVFRTSLPANGWPFLGNFRSGRCWFKGEGNKWGCYNRAGEVAIPPGFYFEQEELLKEKAYTRDSILQTLFPLPMDFSCGVAAASIMGPAGVAEPAVIDTAGRQISLAGEYQDIGRFDAQGLAVVRGRETGRQGLINGKGEVLLEPEYQEIGSFINGFAAVQAGNGRWGLASREGRIVVPFQYHEVDTVSEGLVAVRPSAQPFWVFVDTANELRIKGPFEHTQPFFNGYTLATQRGRKLIINRQGEPVYMKNDTALFYSEGVFGMKEGLPPELAELLRNSRKEFPSKYYYADASGNNLFGRYFDHISPFAAGIAAVQPAADAQTERRRFGAVNKRGVMVVPPKYGFVKRQPDGNIGTNPQRFYGLIDKNGKKLIEAEYDRIEPFGEYDLYRVERGEKIGYLMKRDGEMVWAWELQN
ncbi:MAG: WG repeat-containing protein [Phaeodactylibacter sp.]|nr:WG repeat-containing protein [Phaeodactylibacter sp.]